MYKRKIVKRIINEQKDGFISIIYGPRRVGKTYLLNQLKDHYGAENSNVRMLFLDGDTKEAGEAIGTNSEIKLENLVKNFDVILIDEAQRISNIGLALKIIIDKFPWKKIFVTGSSSLELSKGLQESLTGRNKEYQLYPLGVRELLSDDEVFKNSGLLSHELIYGAYPYALSIPLNNEKESYLKQIINDYLFKDVQFLEEVDSDIMYKMASMLAFQIGSEVSLQELSRGLGVTVKTVSRYIHLLKKTFVIIEVGAYSTNKRNEISKSKKYYFYDLGIRNALVNNFASLETRNDVGQLWENFLFLERLKKHGFEGKDIAVYFWRNYVGAEVDMIEEESRGLSAFEFKWGKGNARTPKAFYDSYGIKAQLINRDNYLDFV